MKVYPDSQKLMTINTHKGLCVCKRLMYGLNGAPAIWQRYVDGLFQGMDGVKLDRLSIGKNIDKNIEEAAKNCVDYTRYKADPPKSKVNYWEYPSMPWERIHVDFAGPIFEHTFFLIVDAHSKWLEVYPMKVTTTKKTNECLRDSFARFGLPRVLVSDNGSQFTSYEFQ
ncbi:uncharacterized protein K02A2.6 [Trichonephila clavipes]|nr:uncharacterized protein K02A2.6 [Trichonephila clavipes]